MFQTLTSESFFFRQKIQQTRRMEMRKRKKTCRQSKKVIAVRKSCSASGTGLSHYILVKE